MYYTTSKCFEHHYAHPQEVKIVFLQHLVLSLSMSGRVVAPVFAGAKHGAASEGQNHERVKIKL
jgi:hypothetical protein